MAYRGIIKIDVPALLEKYRIERQDKDAKDRMERDLYLDFMADKGEEAQTRMMKSLDEFAKMDEFKSLHKQFTGILSEHKERREEQETKSEATKAAIDR